MKRKPEWGVAAIWRFRLCFIIFQPTYLNRINTMRLFLFASFLLGVLFVAGCGGDSAAKRGIPPLVPCVLTFQFEDGTPVDGAIVRLFPDDTENKWVSGGGTDADGVVEIRTDGDFSGVPKGTYKVTCSKSEAIPTGQMSEEGEEAMDTKILVARAYTRPNTTPLALTVTDAPINEVFKVGKP